MLVVFGKLFTLSLRCVRRCFPAALHTTFTSFRIVSSTSPQLVNWAVAVQLSGCARFFIDLAHFVCQKSMSGFRFTLLPLLALRALSCQCQQAVAAAPAYVSCRYRGGVPRGALFSFHSLVRRVVLKKQVF